jgi:hypothetical protein
MFYFKGVEMQEQSHRCRLLEMRGGVTIYVRPGSDRARLAIYPAELGKQPEKMYITYCPFCGINLLQPEASDPGPIPEIIICSAIKTSDGQIVRGHRHCDAMNAAANRDLKPWRGEDSQGFITSTNRYVGRKEALAIQKAAGIPSAMPGGEYCFGWLDSSDLY